MKKKNDDFSKLFIFLLYFPIVIFSFLTQVAQSVASLISKHKYQLDLEITRIDEMDGIEFEVFTSELLQKLNFKSVTMTKASGDFGVDIIAYKNNCKYAVQCKRYNSPVGVKAIQEAIGGQKFYQANKSIVVTNSIFTKNAIIMAKECNVELWDRSKLLQLIKQISTSSTDTNQRPNKNVVRYNQSNRDEVNFQDVISQNNKNVNTKSEKLALYNIKQSFTIVNCLRVSINILFSILGIFLIIIGIITLSIYFATGIFTIISGLISIPLISNKIKPFQNLSYSKLVLSKVVLISLFFLIAILFVPISN